MEISKAIRRVDNDEKVSGIAKFIADVKLEGMLYAKTLRSTRPRARIKSIKIPKLPNGYFIVDKNDVPANNRVKLIFTDQPFFAEDVVNYIGEPILLVVGPDKAKVLEILEQIEVEYEDLEPIFTIEDAESGTKPPIFGDDNLFADYEFTKGDPDAAFARAYRIIEGEYRTGIQEHIYLEPQGMLATYEDGTVTVYGSMQCPFYVKNALVYALGWPEDRVRVVQTTTGGGFGGKEDYPSLIAGHAAFAAIKTGRPVQLILDRTEDIEATTKRHPSIIRHRTALDASGRIIAMEIDIKLDGGAYATLSPVVLQRSMFVSTGPYHIPNVRVRGRAYATNNVPRTAFRGFGAPQSIFAVEMHMTNIAEALGENPIDFKMRYFLKKGDDTATGGSVHTDVKLDEMTRQVIEMSNFYEKFERFRKEKGDTVLRGIGFSAFLHGCGFTGKGEEVIKATAKLRRRDDGKVEILVSSVEIGQGAQTTLRKIVAFALGIPMEDVVYENPDTSRVPDSGPTVASRTVIIVGGLLEQAAKELKARWNESGEIEVIKTYRHPEYVRWDDEKFVGDAYPEYSWGVNVAEVEVDPVTFEVRVKKVWGVYDVGTPLDERVVRGQLEGGIVQAVGYATIEVMESKNGKLMQNTITDYIIPTSIDAPEIETRLVVSPYPYGPFGAKCLGELPMVGCAPAVAAAIQHALGLKVDEIPARPELLLKKWLEKSR
ncbi:MAG: aldehyde oxidase [Candidatus Hydrothermota bacterium]|nr:MAG: aldehyde oxidase [Candidatus Hydrothermae bacterium]